MARGSRNVLLACATAAGLIAAAPGAASAKVSHARASAIAVRALGGGTVLGLPHPVRRGAVVVDGGPSISTLVTYVPRGIGTGLRWHVRSRRLARAAWLYWRDPAPGQRFPHRTRLALVDARSGRVVRRMALDWWPVVNGRRVAFAGEPWPQLDPRYAVSGGARTRRVRPSPHYETTVPAGLNDTTPLASGLDLSQDCVITMINSFDPQFRSDVTTWQAFAKRLGISYREARTVTALDQRATEAQAAGCKDVVLVIAGHGFPQSYVRDTTVLRTPVPYVLLGPPEFKAVATSKSSITMTADVTDTVDVPGVVNVMRRHPDQRFKLIIDACYSGAWQDARRLDPDPEQIAVIATSSSATQVSPGGPVLKAGGGVVQVLPSPFGFAMPSGIVSWATGSASVSVDGGDLAKGIARAFKALPSGEATERGPTVSTSVSAQLAPASSGGECEVHDSYDGRCTRPGQVAVRVSMAFGGDGEGTVDIAPNGGSEDSENPPPGTGNPYFHDLFFFAPLGATVTLTATPKGGSHWLQWDPIATEHNQGCPQTGPGSPPTCSVTLPEKWDKGIGYDITAVPDFAKNP